MNLYSLMSLIAAVFFGLMGFYILKINIKSRLNHIFFGIILCYFFFALGYVFMCPAPDEKTFWFWYKFTSWGWTIIFAFILHFYLLLAGVDKVIPRFGILIYLIYLPGIIFYAVLLKDFLFIKEVVRGRDFWIEIPNSGSPQFLIFHIYFISYILLGLIVSIISLRYKKYEIERKQILWIAGLGIMNTLISVITNSINPILGVTLTPPLGHVTAIFWIGGIFFLIQRYHILRDTSPIVYNQALSKIMDMIVVIDPEGRIVKINDQVSRSLLYDSHELINTRLDFLVGKPEFLENILTHFQQYESEPVRAEVNLLSKNGNQICCTCAVSPIRNRFGDIVSYIIVLNDIRQLKLLETEIFERKTIELQLKETIRQKEVMMREVHHRVKNNLNLIISLIGLQMESNLPTDKDRMVLKATQGRIQVMAYIYEYLYRSENLTSIRVLSYIKYMMSNFFYLYGNENLRAEILYSIPEDIEMNIETLIPLGLIINELYSNAIEFAFKEQQNNLIKISLLVYPDNQYCLVFSDNGIGIDPEINIKNLKTLGLKLVSILSSQLKGNLEIIKEGGSRFEIRFRELI